MVAKYMQMIFIVILFIGGYEPLFYLYLYFILWNKTNCTCTLKINVKIKASKEEKTLHEYLINI